MRSIVGRYLEHERVYAFGCGQDTRVYIASGDFLTRNTERRVEVGVRIQDRRIAGELLQMLDLQLRDNVNAREMQPDGTYPKVKPAPDASRVDSQLGMYDMLAGTWPAMPAPRPAGGTGTSCADSTPPCCRFAAASAPPGSAAPANAAGQAQEPAGTLTLPKLPARTICCTQAVRVLFLAFAA